MTDYRFQPVNMRVWAHLQLAEPNLARNLGVEPDTLQLKAKP